MHWIYNKYGNMSSFNIYKYDTGKYVIVRYKPEFTGTPKDIALQIINNFTKDHHYDSDLFTIIKKPYLHIQFERYVVPPDDESIEDFAAKINAELKRYTNLLIFI